MERLPTCSVIAAHMKRKGVCGSGPEQAALVIPGRCFPEVIGEHVARKSVTNEKDARSPSQRYLKFAPAGRLSDDLVVWTRTQEGDRWRHSQSCLAACWSLYTTVLTEW